MVLEGKPMTNSTYKIILTYRIFADNPHYSSVYNALEEISADYQGKHDETTSTYLFCINNERLLNSLFEEIKLGYQAIVLTDTKVCDDDIRAFIVAPDGRCNAASLKLQMDKEMNLYAVWEEVGFEDYYNAL